MAIDFRAAVVWIALIAVQVDGTAAAATPSSSVPEPSASAAARVVSDVPGQLPGWLTNGSAARRMSQAGDATTTQVPTHCFPYSACDQTRPCPACAWGPAPECEPAPGESGALCTCSVYRVHENCDFGDHCFQRCINDHTDYVFAVQAHPPTTTTTFTTLPPTSTTITTTPPGTSTTTTTTTVSSTLTTTTSTTTMTSTTTTVTVLDLLSLTATQLRDLARLSEDTIASSLLESNGTTNMTLRTPIVTVSAQLVDVAQLTADASTSLHVPDSSITIAVPSAVLQAVGGNVIVSVAAFNESLVSSFEPTYKGKPLAAAPVSVRLRSATTLQDASFGSSMPGEVLIEMLPSTPPEARCGYWDEAKAEWSSKGLTRVAGNGTFACATTHLTLFAAILGEFERVIVCSNAHVFSDEGIQAIARGDWWNRAPAWVLWIILLTQILLLGWAAVVDFRIYYKAIWRDVDFLTTNEAFQGRDLGCVGWMAQCIGRYLPGDEGDMVHPNGETRAKRRRCCGRCRAVCDSITVTMTADCATYQVARDEKIAPEDLRDIVLGGPNALAMEQQIAKSTPPKYCSQCQTPFADGERFCSSCGYRREVPSSSFDDSWKALRSQMSRQAHGLADTIQCRAVPRAVDGLRSNFWIRLWGMYAALHPWVQLRQFSITLGTSVRALMLTGKLLGALAVCSLFFDTMGSPLAKGMPASCTRAGFWQHFWRNVVLGLVSTILSLVPLLIIMSLSNRRFIYQETWSKELKRSYVQCWRTQDVLLVSMSLIYCGVCILYCMAFLANIDESSEAEWLTSAVVVLIREFILVPLGLAALYALVATCVTRARPELSSVVQHKVKNFVGLNVPPDEEGLEDAAVSEQGTVNEGSVGSVASEQSWADRVNSDALMNGPSEALEAFGEEDFGPLPPLADLEVVDAGESDTDMPMKADEASERDPNVPMKAGLDFLPNVPDMVVHKEAKPTRPPPCDKCGSRMWAAFQSEICPMCGHLLRLKPQQ